MPPFQYPGIKLPLASAQLPVPKSTKPVLYLPAGQSVHAGSPSDAVVYLPPGQGEHCAHIGNWFALAAPPPVASSNELKWTPQFCSAEHPDGTAPSVLSRWLALEPLTVASAPRNVLAAQHSLLVVM
jgi:hypothetical protein